MISSRHFNFKIKLKKVKKTKKAKMKREGKGGREKFHFNQSKNYYGSKQINSNPNRRSKTNSAQFSFI